MSEQLAQNLPKEDAKTSERRIQQILQLKSSLVPMLALRDLLAQCNSTLIIAIRSVRVARSTFLCIQAPTKAERWSCVPSGSGRPSSKRRWTA